jgi:Rrf2 family protein
LEADFIVAIAIILIAVALAEPWTRLMLALTRKTDYALIALTHLAQNAGVVCTAREIAEKFHIPAALLMNVLKTLNQGELVKSVRGAKGGYSLAIEPEGVSLASIIRVIEGPVRFVQCSGESSDHVDECELSEVCPIKLPLQRIHARLENFLRQITLADIVRDSTTSCQQTSLTVASVPCKPSGCCRSAAELNLNSEWNPGEAVRPL